ncbi:MAG: hypothetical protein QME68_00550 [Elusimicrobiota bacterium]|nr:hypothetical protein [Elusimicrobiota bacterium]
MNKKLFITLLLFLLTPGYIYSASSLNLDVDYQLRGFLYPNLDYNTKTSTDAVAYYTQRLRVTLLGKFIPQIEICTKLQAIGVVGMEDSSRDKPSQYQGFNWQKEYPYPNTNFLPFVENAYAKILRVADLPADLTIGRQQIEYPSGFAISDVKYASGFLVSDNDAGMNAIKLVVDYPYKLHTEVFIAKLKENFYPSKDYDINIIAMKYPIKGHEFEFGYILQENFTETIYSQGTSTGITNSILKQFYSVRISKSGKWGYYCGQYIFQKGNISLIDGPNIKLDGRAIILEGRLFGEQKRLGKVSGFGIISASTGKKSLGLLPAGGSFWSTDETFSPDLTRRFDGLKRHGMGEYFSLSPFDTLWDIPKLQTLTPEGVKPAAYSGFGTFGFGLDFSPWYGWSFGASGFYFSASEAHYLLTQPGKYAVTYAGGASFSLDMLAGILIGKDLKEASMYSLGAELNLFARYSYSKYIDFKLSYSRYTPPTVPSVWPQKETSDFYLFEMNTRF